MRRPSKAACEMVIVTLGEDGLRIKYIAKNRKVANSQPLSTESTKNFATRWN
jgi:hypothetical protein